MPRPKASSSSCSDGLQQARGEPAAVQRRPEPVARSGEVVPGRRRVEARVDAAEEHRQVRREDVGNRPAGRRRQFRGGGSRRHDQAGGRGRRTASSTRSSTRLSSPGRAAGRQVQDQAVVGQLEELGEHLHGHVVAQHARLAAGVPAARGWPRRSRPSARPSAWRTPGRCAAAGRPRAGCRASRRCRRRWSGAGPAGHASPGRGRCGRRSRPWRRRRPRRPPGRASPCRGSGGRSRHGTGRWPPRAGGRWRPRSRTGRSSPRAAARISWRRASSWSWLTLGTLRSCHCRSGACNPYVRLARPSAGRSGLGWRQIRHPGQAFVNTVGLFGSRITHVQCPGASRLPRSGRHPARSQRCVPAVGERVSWTRSAHRRTTWTGYCRWMPTA